MADNTPAIAGVQKCGCITYVNARPDNLDRDDKKTLMEIVEEGGSIRRATVDELRGDPDFFPSECPHDPPGWKYEPAKPWEPTARCRRGYKFGVEHVDIKVRKGDRDGLRSGEVTKRDGSWWSTPHSFDPGPDLRASRHEGGEAVPVHPLGPFKTKREAKAALIPIALKQREEWEAEWARERAEKLRGALA